MFHTVFKITGSICPNIARCTFNSLYSIIDNIYAIDVYIILEVNELLDPLNGRKTVKMLI